MWVQGSEEERAADEMVRSLVSILRAIIKSCVTLSRLLWMEGKALVGKKENI